jgi:hypothetical protein
MYKDNKRFINFDILQDITY